MARPSLYEKLVKPRLEEIVWWSRDGLKMDDMAAMLDCNSRSLYNYRDKYPEFAAALRRGRDYADYKVENGLYRRAIGYHYNETTRERNEATGQLEISKVVTRYQGPDVGACAFWLKNRKSSVWKDRQPEQLQNTSELDALAKAINASRKKHGMD